MPAAAHACSITVGGRFDLRAFFRVGTPDTVNGNVFINKGPLDLSVHQALEPLRVVALMKTLLAVCT